MEYDVRVEQLAGGHLAVVRRKASLAELPRVVPEACGLVWGALKAAGVAGAGRMVAIYWDSEMNIDVGVEVPGPFAGQGEVVGAEGPSGASVAVTHFGPYGGLKQAHEAIHRWAEANGHELARPCWEVYGHWTPECDADPSKIRTDVFYRLKGPNAVISS